MPTPSIPPRERRLDLVVAIIDIETANVDTVAGGWPGRMGAPFNDAWEFACGVIRWVHFRRVERRQVAYTVLAENVYWSPVAMLADLHLPYHHVISGFNIEQFDLPVIIGAAVPERAGPFLRDPSPADVVAVARRMREVHLGGWPLAVLSRLPEYSPPRGPLQRLAAWWKGRGLDVTHGTAFEADRLVGWVKRHQRHSTPMFPVGTTGLGLSREGHLRRLLAYTVDPMKVWEEHTGHPHVVSLNDLRAAMEKAAGRPVTTARTLNHAELPSMWAEGLVWQVIEECRSDVGAVADLLHLGVNARAIGVDNLRTTYKDADGVRREAPGVLALRSQREHGLFEFHLPTWDWWTRMEGAARARRAP